MDLDTSSSQLQSSLRYCLCKYRCMCGVVAFSARAVRFTFQTSRPSLQGPRGTEGSTLNSNASGDLTPLTRLGIWAPFRHKPKSMADGDGAGVI
ncbi:hypothetical protein PAHAL_6G258200 [Panicum hallii]|uniref:Uncharacterized protein n=1 Tax=Panicum hallii TaxID=206008 RepID=A0A2T8IHK1_9POAL|nr:hypothetical protein PAHAL_6G258200 [Panicum hallii]